MTMRRRTASGLALVLGAAALASVGPAQASTWLPGVGASELGDVFDPQVVVDAGGVATAVWVGSGLSGFEIQTATRGAGAADFGLVQTLTEGLHPSVVLHPDGAVTVAWENSTTTWATTRGPVRSASLCRSPSRPDRAKMLSTLRGSPSTVRGTCGCGRVLVRRPAPRPAGPRGVTRSPTLGVHPRRSPQGRLQQLRDRGCARRDPHLCVGHRGRHRRRGRAAVGSHALARGNIGTHRLDRRLTGELGRLALTDNAAGVTALSWTRTGAAGADLQVALRPETDGAFGPHHGLSGMSPSRGTSPSSSTRPDA